MLSHAVELWCIMDSQMSCRSCCSQVFIEHITEVLTSSVRTKDLDCLKMLLHLHSCLEMLVSIKSLCLGVEISDCVLSSIVGKCNDILATVLARDWAQSSNIHVNFFTKVLCLQAHTHRWDGLVSCSSKNAAIARCFVRVRVELNPKDQYLFDKSVCLTAQYGPCGGVASSQRLSQRHELALLCRQCNRDCMGFEGCVQCACPWVQTIQGDHCLKRHSIVVVRLRAMIKKSEVWVNCQDVLQSAQHRDKSHTTSQSLQRVLQAYAPCAGAKRGNHTVGRRLESRGQVRLILWILQGLYTCCAIYLLSYCGAFKCKW